ncbi:MAG: SEL1-like repeat protein [Candidatus Aminicenantes bacterium]|nr:SEL1-like repeat protein [Candidatus Aminicenantes bacterium]
MNGKRAEEGNPAELESYREAAEKGDAHSQAQLGKMYLLGLGVIRDFKLALAWLQKSAAQANGEAQAYLGEMYEKGLGVDADMQQAVAWYKRSIVQGHALAQIRLGDLYLSGLGVDQSIRKAIACYLEAAEQVKDPESSGLAHLRMGAMYFQGRGVEKDLRKAFGIFQQAARLGNAEAQFRVGTMYRDGVGVQRNHKKAMEWLQKSTGKNRAPANNAMGDLYRDGLVVARDIHEAMKWYKKAAARGDPYAKIELAKLQQEKSAQEKSAASVGAGAIEEKTGKRKEKVAESRVVSLRDGRQTPPRASKASSLVRKGSHLKTAPGTAPRRERRVRRIPTPRIGLYLPAVIGGIALSLIIVFLAFGGKEDKPARGVESDAIQIAVLPWPAARPLPPALPQPPPEFWQPIGRSKTPPKPGSGDPPPITATAPAAMPSEPATPRLRREFRTLDEGQIAAMLAAGNLFDAKRNPAGSFPHRFEPLNVDGLRLIVDHAPRLVWTRQQNPVKMNLKKSGQWIASLNRLGYGGIRTWRLPTVEEAASLLQRGAGGGKSFLPDAFAADITEIWTGDSLTESESWIVDFLGGTVRSAKNKSRLMSLMVSYEPGALLPTIPDRERPANGSTEDDGRRE